MAGIDPEGERALPNSHRPRSLRFEGVPRWDGEKISNTNKSRAIKTLRQDDPAVSNLVAPRGFEPLFDG